LETKDEIIARLEQENLLLRASLETMNSGDTLNVDWLQKIFDSLPNPLFIKDENHCFVSLNQKFLEMLSLNSEDLFGKSDYDFFPKEQADIFWEKDSEVLKTGKSNFNEEKITTGSETRTLLTSKVRIKDVRNKSYVLGTITDITERKKEQILRENQFKEIEIQKEKIEVLLKEVHHRVKNNLQIVSSLLSLQKNRFEDEKVKDVFFDCQNRIFAIAKVHDVLYRDSGLLKVNFETYITSLLKNIDLAFNQKNKIKFTINVTGSGMVLDDVIPLGLVINELVTNSVKHAGRDNEELEIYIELSEEDGVFTLKLGDNGIGILTESAKGPNHIGVELIEIFCDQLEATLKIVDKELGLHYEMSFQSSLP
jgi:PAS domain S-box-containing protein